MSWGIENKVVVITGANVGIGKETAVGLAGMGATTVLACRNLDTADAAAADIRERSSNDDVHVVKLDLADLESVRQCAAEILERWDHLDVLVNNAGGVWTERHTTAQGFEQTFGVNHLGPFYLTTLLLDRLLESAPARVINLSSTAHLFAFGGMRWDDLQFERNYDGFRAYTQSKLANILFTRGLARRVDATKVVTHAAHPGAVRSGFGMDGDMTGIAAIGNRIVRPFEISPTAGASTPIFLASDPSVAGRTGDYWARRKPKRMSRAARDDSAVERLWSESERLLKSAGFAPAPTGSVTNR
jgi:NAD(P)-dependent dehydrogenase (short-subunit alcohol dehydrogenase family)